MPSPYSTPSADVSSKPLAPRPLSLLFLGLVATLYGSCGSVLSAPMALMFEVGSVCSSSPGPPPIAPSHAWLASSLASVVVPTALYAMFGRHMMDRGWKRAVLGATSVVGAVVVSFGCWRLLSSVPLPLEPGHYVQGLAAGLVAGGMLSPVGVVFGLMLVPERPEPSVPREASITPPRDPG